MFKSTSQHFFNKQLDLRFDIKCLENEYRSSWFEIDVNRVCGKYLCNKYYSEEDTGAINQCENYENAIVSPYDDEEEGESEETSKVKGYYPPNYYIDNLILPDGNFVYIANDGDGQTSRYSKCCISQQDRSDCCAFIDEKNILSHQKEQRRILRETIKLTGKKCQSFNNYSTLTAVMYHKQQLTVGQLGDSVALLITTINNAKGEKTYKAQLLTPSFNVKYANKKEKIRIGKSIEFKCDAEKAVKVANRWMYDNYLWSLDGEKGMAYTRALGGNKQLPGFSYNPAILSYDISKQEEAHLLLCSDGVIPDGINIQYVENYLNNGGAIQDLAKVLRQRSYNCWPTISGNDNVEPDNMTVMVTTLKRNNQCNDKYSKLFYVADGAGDSMEETNFASAYVKEHLFSNFTKISGITIRQGLNDYEVIDDLLRKISKKTTNKNLIALDKQVRDCCREIKELPAIITRLNELNLLLNQTTESSKINNAIMLISEYIKNIFIKYNKSIQEIIKQLEKLPKIFEDNVIANTISSIKKTIYFINNQDRNILEKYLEIKTVYNDLQSIYEWCFQQLAEKEQSIKMPSDVIDWIVEYRKQQKIVNKIIENYKNGITINSKIPSVNLLNKIVIDSLDKLMVMNVADDFKIAELNRLTQIHERYLWCCKNLYESMQGIRHSQLYGKLVALNTDIISDIKTGKYNSNFEQNMKKYDDLQRYLLKLAKNLYEYNCTSSIDKSGLNNLSIAMLIEKMSGYLNKNSKSPLKDILEQLKTEQSKLIYKEKEGDEEEEVEEELEKLKFDVSALEKKIRRELKKVKSKEEKDDDDDLFPLERFCK